MSIRIQRLFTRIFIIAINYKQYTHRVVVACSFVKKLMKVVFFVCFLFVKIVFVNKKT